MSTPQVLDSRQWTGDGRHCGTCGIRPSTQCRLRGYESCLKHASHTRQRCYRSIEVIRQADEGATGFMGIDFVGTRTCGGRLNGGKCEFCDVTTIEGKT